MMGRVEAADGVSRAVPSLVRNAPRRRQQRGDVWRRKGRVRLPFTSTILGHVPFAKTAFLCVTAAASLSGCVPRLDFCCFRWIIDHPSYLQPPTSVVIGWLDRHTFPDSPKFEGLGGTAYYFHWIDPKLPQADLNRFTAGKRGGAADYFQTLLMTCESTRDGQRCSRTVPVTYVCLHGRPRPGEFSRFYWEVLQVEVHLRQDLVESARAMPTVDSGREECPSGKLD